ncbi:ATP-binding protein [Pararcticibacter amylolyticus]|uniref:AAA family ATPase n=1 Tax=Pararcticibacter amylolyticus TaxID=2173175 RepID=A0A2U2PJV3_9SPHI|nr:AAA family ATPase [Pararcticibacter amylolyticus]PWG81687.1 AAA family ATPase [Pararcticibacter amylolyticus]
MFNRSILSELALWSTKSRRKPLVIRGARQVGKTTAVNQFAQQFEQYIYLNLEVQSDRQPFDQFKTIETLVQTLFFLKNLSLTKKDNTLLFIDEIQEVPEALNILRYFYETEPGIAVIAAGSLLETLFDKNISFPVGRVEYKILRPVSFPEFLAAIGEKEALQYLEQIPIPAFTHEKMLTLFHTYALIGGMPEVIADYSQNKDLNALSTIYDSLITAYIDDVEKYTSSASQVQHIRHAIRASFSQAGKRIKFEGFGNSPYRSRDMGEALRTLEKALLIQLTYPCTQAQLPLLPDYKRSPRLQVLDTGMLNYFVGIQKEILGTPDLNNVYQGTLIEHLVGQELLATQFNALSALNFWVREKKESTAEVDYIWVFEGKLIPIEVKSGTEGKLKSLHLYMDMATHAMAVRFYAGEISITKAYTLAGKIYYLLNLPYYLVSCIELYLQWFQKQIQK